MPSREKLAEFVAWLKQHLTGDEKGESRSSFWSCLYQAFGQAGLKAAGATLDNRPRPGFNRSATSP
jgi:hypothetical protein